MSIFLDLVYTWIFDGVNGMTGIERGKRWLFCFILLWKSVGLNEQNSICESGILKQCTGKKLEKLLTKFLIFSQ